MEEIISFEKKLEENNNELEESELKLLKSKEKAEEALAVKSQFLSNMSHEMRTPLNSILGFVELIEVDKEDKWEYLDYISKASENMAVLVDDILDYSKFESEKNSLDRAPFKIHNVITEVYGLFKLSAQNKGIKLIKIIAFDESVLLFGDEVRIKQILINLISNAIKFTSEGYVKILASLMDVNKGETRLLLQIIDTGIGIEESNQELIFQRFTQVELEDRRSYIGTGLGLSIVKQIVTTMGGEIEVDSELGKGSEFRIDLLFDIAQEPIEKQKTELDLHLSIKGLRFLVVDDNEMNLCLLGNMFKHEKTVVDLADNGIKALEMLRTNQYDYLLLDLQMPEITGIDVYKEIQSNEKMYALNQSMKTIIITADTFPETKSEINKVGIKSVLNKPIKKTDLFRMINKLSS